MDDHIGPPVAAPGLDQEHPVHRIGTEPVGQGAPRRTTPDRSRGVPLVLRFFGWGVAMFDGKAPQAPRSVQTVDAHPSRAGVAQLVEQLIRNQQVSSSSLLAGPNLALIKRSGADSGVV